MFSHHQFHYSTPAGLRELANDLTTVTFLLVTLLGIVGGLSLILCYPKKLADQWGWFVLPTILFLPPYAGLWLSLAIIYYPIPKFLTFGFRVGGVVPRTCEGSVEIMGRDRMPCLLNRVKEISRKVVHEPNKGVPEEVVHEMNRYTLLATALVCLVVLPIIGFVALVRSERKKEQERRLNVEKAVGDVKSVLDLEKGAMNDYRRCICSY
jgi:hypothetical protein